MTAVALGMPEVRREADAARERPAVPGLVDRFGRVARDLRVSITERCSLRCTYCMPAEGLPRLPKDAVLTAEEIARLVAIAARDLGVREVRFTGGEPLMRRDLVEIVARTAAQAPGVRLSMTTNAVGLEHRVADLVSAGLDRINISLDTVDREEFARLTRRDRLRDVLRGIRAAQDAGLEPVKVNAVLMPETVDGAPALLEWALAEGVRLRFIEEMPLDADGAWDRGRMVTAADLLAVLGRRFGLTPAGRDDPNAPAEEWLVDGGPGTVGVIASVTRSFCDACDRTRLTAEGTVRSCLFGDEETDLRGPLRAGAADAVLADLWREAMWRKPRGHGVDAPGFVPPLRSMGAIGG